MMPAIASREVAYKVRASTFACGRIPFSLQRLSRFPVLPAHSNFNNIQRFNNDSTTATTTEDNHHLSSPQNRLLAAGLHSNMENDIHHHVSLPERIQQHHPSENEAFQQKGLVNFKGALKNRAKKDKICTFFNLRSPRRSRSR